MSRRNVAALALVCAASPAYGAPITLLHSFTGGPTDGSTPTGLLLDGSTLYGTTYDGGLNGGTVYRLNNDGTGFGLLHSFQGLNVDGQNPHGNLVISGSRLFGTTGTYGGTVFGIDTGGSNFSTLHTYPWVIGPGTGPAAGLAISGSTLYGTTVGTSSSPQTAGGTVFSIQTNGSAHTQLHDFGTDPVSEGRVPRSAVTLSGNIMFGMTESGGPDDQGTIFRMNTDGTGFTTLHRFSGYQQVNPVDGSLPSYTAMQLVGSRLYGVARFGGSTTQATWNEGVLFGIDTDGTDFEVYHSFGAGTDGAYPTGSLAIVGSTLFGTTSDGGDYGLGTLYQINLDGSGYSVVHSFAGGPNDGARPFDAGLIVTGNTLYGTTNDGGTANLGTVYSILVPQPATVFLLMSMVGLRSRARRA